MTSPADANVTIYDTLGRKVKDVRCSKGISSIELGNTGIYIVNVNGITKKILVK